MGGLTPFVMRCEYQTHKAQVARAFHFQAAFLFIPSLWVQAGLARN